MIHEKVIILEKEKRCDGSVYISSPNMPLLHIVIPEENQLEDMVFPIVKTMLEHRLGYNITLRIADLLHIDLLCLDENVESKGSLVYVILNVIPGT